METVESSSQRTGERNSAAGRHPEVFAACLVSGQKGDETRSEKERERNRQGLEKEKRSNASKLEEERQSIPAAVACMQTAGEFACTGCMRHARRGEKGQRRLFFLFPLLRVYSFISAKLHSLSISAPQQLGSSSALWGFSCQASSKECKLLTHQCQRKQTKH